MRTIMYIGSLAMVATGIFCLANGSAAFLSVAFVIGIIFALMGVTEFIIGRRASQEVLGVGMNLASDGIILFVFGIIILSGQITDDITAQMLFALWLTIESTLSVGGNFSELPNRAKEDNAGVVLGVAMLILGIYTFFNTRVLNLNAILLIGASIILLGLKRFRISFSIEYTKSGFLTGNEERLKEAEEEERKALAKAKEGIREQKVAQRRIEKIKSDIEQDTVALNELANRKREEAEKNNK